MVLLGFTYVYFTKPTSLFREEKQLWKTPLLNPAPERFAMKWWILEVGVPTSFHNRSYLSLNPESFVFLVGFVGTATYPHVWSSTPDLEHPSTFQKTSHDGSTPFCLPVFGRFPSEADHLTARAVHVHVLRWSRSWDHPSLWTRR